jgi:sulfate transport system ATP-binding protein
MEQGRIAIAGGGTATDGAAVQAYARPHDMELARDAADDSALEAVVTRIQAIGAVARIELQPRAGGASIEVELPIGRFRELDLRTGERVFARPSRLKVF